MKKFIRLQKNNSLFSGLNEDDIYTVPERAGMRGKLLSQLSAQALRSGSFSFSIAFNRQQLADYLCVERAARSVELSKLQKEDVLEL